MTDFHKLIDSYKDCTCGVAHRCEIKDIRVGSGLVRQVGAILVKDKHILTTGYNGAPKGLVHCGEIGCLRQQLGVPSGERHELCRALHAEQNAIIQAANLGIAIEGSTLYCTTAPCSLCAKMLINAGVVRVVFDGAYPDERAMEFFREAGMIVEQLTVKQ